MPRLQSNRQRETKIDGEKGKNKKESEGDRERERERERKKINVCVRERGRREGETNEGGEIKLDKSRKS